MFKKYKPECQWYMWVTTTINYILFFYCISIIYKSQCSLSLVCVFFFFLKINKKYYLVCLHVQKTTQNVENTSMNKLSKAFNNETYPMAVQYSDLLLALGFVSRTFCGSRSIALFVAFRHSNVYLFSYAKQ